MSGRVAARLLLAWVLLAAQGASGSADDSVAAELRELRARIEELERARAEYEDSLRERERLERRVEELEAAAVAHEDATRSLLRRTFSEWGSRISEFVDFGGVIEMAGGWERDFASRDEPTLRLETAELQFEVQVTDWARGDLVVEYSDGADLLANTINDEYLPVDRINIDTAVLRFGDTSRFWPTMSFGRMIVPFGISTGDPVADVLSIADPLTVEVFETKHDALLFGAEFPTPPLAPEIATPAPPPVRPLVVRPLIAGLGRLLGYRPLPAAPRQPELVVLPPPPAPFMVGVYTYQGETFEANSREGEWDPAKHLGATIGHRARGRCRPLLGDPGSLAERSWLNVFCPWRVDLNVDFNRSVFDSDFLGSEYVGFLDQIGAVTGMAGHLKASLGPVALVAEWDGAVEHVEFIAIDDPRTFFRIRPQAWQVALSYQFDWNPSVEAIGAQGTYLTVGYSESRDLGGVMYFVPGPEEVDRVGFVPRRRVLVGVGEWILPNLRLALEYTHDWDYGRREGGTGDQADNVSSMLTFEW